MEAKKYRERRSIKLEKEFHAIMEDFERMREINRWTDNAMAREFEVFRNSAPGSANKLEEIDDQKNC